MPYQILFTRKAEKEFRALPDRAVRLIAPRVRALADNPRPRGVVKLTGEDNVWRIRVGDYRVVYEIHDDRLIVVVIRLAQRGEAYR
jgi:mRNA interferase RelE/StbE